MNLKSKLKDIIVWILFCIIVMGVIVIFFNQSQKHLNLSQYSLKRYSFEVLKEKTSPDGLYKMVLYKRSFGQRVHNEYYRKYFESDIAISVVNNMSKREQYVYIGNEMSEPDWLGNKDIFFTSSCGSSCQFIHIVNILEKDKRFIGLIYPVSVNDDFSGTIFKDWFDKEVIFEGLVKGITSEIILNKVYLVFNIKNNQEGYIVKKRFLFVGDRLELIKY